MDYKDTNASLSTITYNKNEVEAPTKNIYEAISVIAKRATQINGDLKKELVDKLDEFATYNDSLEEVFENKEQIEVSKFYERLPKPTAIAVEEWLNNKVYFISNYWFQEYLGEVLTNSQPNYFNIENFEIFNCGIRM